MRFFKHENDDGVFFLNLDSICSVKEWDAYKPSRALLVHHNSGFTVILGST